MIMMFVDDTARVIIVVAVAGNMATISTDSDTFYRVHKALHLVTHEAIPCVDNCLRNWHAIQQQALPPCSVLGPLQCPTGSKPKPPTSSQQRRSPLSSCHECVAWGNAVEAMLYHPVTTFPLARPQLAWQNVNPPILGKSHVEIAKAFVLKLPRKQNQQYTTCSIADFDSVSLLMIMYKFKEFHHSSQAVYDIIKRVSLNLYFENLWSRMCRPTKWPAFECPSPGILKYIVRKNSKNGIKKCKILLWPEAQNPLGLY